MTLFPLAVLCLVLPPVFFAMVYAASFVGRRLSDDEFSWPKYAAWLVVALGFAVLLVAAKTTWVFLVVAGILVLWVLLRAAADAQVTTIREKVGFFQLYAALLVVEYSALVRTGALAGTRASPWFGTVLNDHIAELVLPIASLCEPSRLPAWASPGALVSALSATLAGNLALSLSLSTFGVAAFIYAHFAEHATPKLGLSLLPFPTPIAVLYLVVWVVARAAPATAVGALATHVGIVLSPYFVAEGLWAFQRLAVRLHTRSVWAGLLAMLCLVSPRLTFVLAFLGGAFHLVRLRAFEPVLGDVERSASRPRIRTALVLSVATSALLSGLALADGAYVTKSSPRLAIGPDACSGVTMTPGPSGVAVASAGTQFTIDADESTLVAGTSSDYAAACAGRGKRLCTSDEWTLACVCTYPNESEGGRKTGTNERLAFRVETDTREGTPPDVHGLLGGHAEVVGPATRDGWLVAGASDAIDDPFLVDCRARSLVTHGALPSAGSVVGLRCCK